MCDAFMIMNQYNWSYRL